MDSYSSEKKTQSSVSSVKWGDALIRFIIPDKKLTTLLRELLFWFDGHENDNVIQIEQRTVEQIAWCCGVCDIGRNVIWAISGKTVAYNGENAVFVIETLGSECKIVRVRVRMIKGDITLSYIISDAGVELKEFLHFRNGFPEFVSDTGKNSGLVSRGFRIWLDKFQKHLADLKQKKV